MKYTIRPNCIIFSLQQKACNSTRETFKALKNLAFNANIQKSGKSIVIAESDSYIKGMKEIENNIQRLIIRQIETLNYLPPE